MKINRAASIPLIMHDPYFSVWSPHDHLYDGDTQHWSGALNSLKGILIVDGVRYGFMGEVRREIVIPQKSVDVTATSTEYVFEKYGSCIISGILAALLIFMFFYLLLIHM